MVETARHAVDACIAARQPQEQIPLFGIAVVPEPARCDRRAHANHREPADVVRRQEQFRGPVGLEVRIMPPHVPLGDRDLHRSTARRSPAAVRAPEPFRRAPTVQRHRRSREWRRARRWPRAGRRSMPPREWCQEEPSRSARAHRATPAPGPSPTAGNSPSRRSESIPSWCSSDRARSRPYDERASPPGRPRR